MATLISHFYNEEFLLPFWLQHHANMFDHGILLDYDSTDRSLDIIRELVPHWEIRTSRNRKFDYNACDAEVMDIERGISGWKMVLNTTEFLVCSDLKTFIERFEAKQTGQVGCRTNGLIMVDPLSDAEAPVTSSPLVQQRHYGYVESRYKTGLSRSRLLHNAQTGAYQAGRHYTNHKVSIRNDLFLCWFGWSPMKYIKQRKMQIQTRIPKEHFELRMGIEHKMTDAEYDKHYKNQIPRTVDLWSTEPEFKSQLDLMVSNYKFLDITHWAA